MPANGHALAAVFTAPGQPLELRRLPLPRLDRPGEVLVRVTCCTICGSDLHTYTGRRTTPTPTILGHEIIGEVVDLGPGERSTLDGRPVRVGDRITWSIAASCGECFFCSRDLPQKCERLFKYGHEALGDAHPLSGGLAEYCCLAPGTAIVPLPDGLDDHVAAPASCATATVAAVIRVAGGCRDDVVLVQGAGMLGVTACAMARWLGAREVIACDVDERRLATATEFGATRTAVVEGDVGELARVVDEITGGRGVDVALELSGSGAAIETGLRHLRIGGRAVWAGAVFPAPPIPVTAEDVVRRLLTIRGVHNYTPRDLAIAVEFLHRTRETRRFETLVGKTFPLAEADAAFRHALERGERRVAVVP